MKRDKLPTVLTSKTPKIYKNKKLNGANFGDFNLNDYQVFLHLVSKLGGVDNTGKYLQPEQLQREHTLTAKDFHEVFNLPLAHCYGVLKKAVDKLMKTDIKVEKIKDDKKEVWRVNVCSQAVYKEHEGKIEIQFTDSIMPYLAQVKQKFVLYNLKEIANFGSLYTTRLYELLQDYQETGWMLKSVEELRSAFAVDGKLKTYNDFKKYTFGHACQEINDNYDIGLSFEEIKQSRKVTAVKFTFKKTMVIKGKNPKTGLDQNLYNKPEAKIKVAKGVTSTISTPEKSIKQLFLGLLPKLKPKLKK
jgi:plasmid replication initiation protein